MKRFIGIYSKKGKWLEICLGCTHSIAIDAYGWIQEDAFFIQIII
jgi:hypothetical protein